jgi:protein XagA
VRAYFILAGLLFPSYVLAAGWTQPEGAVQTITTARYYTTDEFFDNNGKRRDQSRYTKYEINPYVEYGLTDAVTLGFNGFLDYITQDSPALAHDTNIMLSDVELFGRFRMAKGEDWVFSLQPLLKLPSLYEHDNAPRSGSEFFDAELSAQAGKSFSWFGRSHFTTVVAGYRHRFDTPKDQFKLEWTTGFSLTDQWQITPQISYTGRVDSVSNPTFTQSGQDDYNLLKLQLGALYHLSETLAVEGGAFVHSQGDNTGSGGGVMLAVWKKF